MQPTHHKKKSSVFDEANRGDVSKLFDEAYQGNVYKLTVMEGKDNAVDVVQKRVVEKGQEEEVKKEKNLQMLHAAHLSTSPPRVYWIAQ